MYYTGIGEVVIMERPHKNYEEYVSEYAAARHITAAEAETHSMVKLFKESIADSIKPSQNIVMLELTNINC